MIMSATMSVKLGSLFYIVLCALLSLQYFFSSVSFFFFFFSYEVEQWYPKPTSSFQDIEMFRSKFFGNVLVIDNEIMITERDEMHYHEMIAHVPLAYLPSAKRVLIIGGGDGGTLSQVLKHSNVDHVTIIELDPAVVATSRKYFPDLAKAYDDGA